MKIEIEYEGVKLISENKILVITAPNVYIFYKIYNIIRDNIIVTDKWYPDKTFQDVKDILNSLAFNEDKTRCYRDSGIDHLYHLLKHPNIGVYNVINLHTPEKNLHPNEIIKLAKIIILLSKIDEIDKIIIDTHSNFLLEAMNLLIKYEFKVDQWHKDDVNKPFEMCDTSDGFMSGEIARYFYDVLKGNI